MRSKSITASVCVITMAAIMFQINVTAQREQVFINNREPVTERSSSAIHATSLADLAISAQDIMWTNLINCVIEGRTLRKDSGTDGMGDAGANSLQSIPSGDGYVEFAAL